MLSSNFVVMCFPLYSPKSNPLKVLSIVYM